MDNKIAMVDFDDNNTINLFKTKEKITQLTMAQKMLK